MRSYEVEETRRMMPMYCVSVKLRLPVRRLVVVTALIGVWCLIVPTAHAATLIAHYASDGNSLDDSGNHHHGTLSGNVGYRTGADGQGFDLSGGTSDYIEVTTLSGAGATSAFAGGGLTITAWFFEDVAGASGPIVNLRHSSNDSGFTLEPQFSTPGTVNFTVFDGTSNGERAQLFASGFSVGELHHIAAVYDPANLVIRVYRNGNLVASDPIPNLPMTINGDETLRIGYNMVNGRRLNGMVDELRIYDGPLGVNEIKALITPTPTALPAGLICLGLLGTRRNMRSTGDLPASIAA